MFYYKNGKWNAFTKKISFKEKREVYDNQDEGYLNNPDFTYVEVEELELTEEQKERLDEVQGAENFSLYEIENYVLNEEIGNLESIIEQNRKQKKIENLIDWDKLTEEEIEEVKGFLGGNNEL